MLARETFYRFVQPCSTEHLEPSPASLAKRRVLRGTINKPKEGRQWEEGWWVEGDAAFLAAANNCFEKLIIATKMLFVFTCKVTAVTRTHVF